MDARELMPEMVERVAFAAVATRSFARAEVMLDKVAGAHVSINTIQPAA